MSEDYKTPGLSPPTGTELDQEARGLIAIAMEYSFAERCYESTADQYCDLGMMLARATLIANSRLQHAIEAERAAASPTEKQE